MNPEAIIRFCSSKITLSAFFGAVGVLIGYVLNLLRNRVRELEYTVTHDRIALSSEDPIFGNIKVSWNNTPVETLFSSIVTIENTTSKDYENITFKVYSAETMMLSEKTELSGSSYIPTWSEPYGKILHVADGALPTDAQFDLYYHSREYHIPVFNRGEKIVHRYLTSVPPGKNGPILFVDLLHQGLKIRFKVAGPQIHGVLVAYALPVGFITSVVILAASISLIHTPWVIGFIALPVGLFAQSIGAGVFKFYRVLKAIIIQ
ncbi:hypothetical protein GETHLI_35810 [Geothrix limicola]|uniref:Uncharacterized protein n=1 Tax=Geothrix limicola TaxID=2927978 RepID=A0ABQ5QKQ6_9BACT|nr:hypothetical protein [Geothrix limicola]GLH75078.1 hypothetical protein GETHLI_35810 [Geothrix limicola]